MSIFDRKLPGTPGYQPPQPMNAPVMEEAPRPAPSLASLGEALKRAETAQAQREALEAPVVETPVVKEAQRPVASLEALGEALQEAPVVQEAPLEVETPMDLETPIAPEMEPASFDSLNAPIPAPEPLQDLGNPQTKEEWDAFRFPDRPAPAQNAPAIEEPAQDLGNPQTIEEWKTFRFPDRPAPAQEAVEPEKEIEKEGRGGDGEGELKPTDPSFYMPLSVGSMAPPKFDETGRGMGGQSAGVVVDPKPTPSLGDLLDLKPSPSQTDGVKPAIQPRTGPRMRR